MPSLSVVSSLLAVTCLAVLLIVATCIAPACTAQEIDRHETTVCAIVDASRLALTPILETKLFELPQTSWVERTEISRVLQEQELRAAFSPEGAGRRSALGQLLKADVLVLLRSIKADAAGGAVQTECVICETKQGLRLFRSLLASDANLERSVELLKQGVETALAKRRQKIQAIVAVPPFLSDDLEFKNNHLQNDYAKLVEQILLKKPSILLVEFSEAQAIAREITLTKPDTPLEQRKLPLYVIGRYRHDGTGADQTLRISLRLMQAEKQLTLKGTRSLPPSDVAGWILKKTIELEPLIDSTAPTSHVASGTEAKQLAARAKVFQQVGNWQEALALYEASLLLQDDADVHRECMIICGKAASQRWPRDSEDIEIHRLQIGMRERGLRHLERFAELADGLAFRDNKDGPPLLSEFESMQFFRRGNPHADPKVQDLVDDFCRGRSETYLRIARFRAIKGHHDRSDNFSWSALSVRFLTVDEKYAAALRVAREWKDVPDQVYQVATMTASGGIRPEDPGKHAAFLDELASIKPLGPTMVDSINQRFDAGEKSLPPALQAAADHEPILPAHPAIKQIVFNRASAESKMWDDRIIGSTPLPDGSDLFWSSGRLYSMRKRGQLDLVYTPGGRDQIVARAYDGKYFWLALFEDFSTLKVVAINPTTGTAMEFSDADGLPVPPARQMDHHREFQLVAVGPGHVCAAGFFDRTWIANMTLSTSGEKKIDIFHEARLVPTVGESDLAKSTHVAFRPSFMSAIYGADAQSCRIVLGRDEKYSDILRTPLIIDPYTKKVELAPFELHGNRQDVFAVGTNEIFLSNQNPHEPKLLRIRYPALQLEVFLEDVPQGILLLQNDQLRILGKKWWTCDIQGRKVTALADGTGWFFGDGKKHLADARHPGPRLMQAMLTNHYGAAGVVYANGVPTWYYMDADELTKQKPMSELENKAPNE